MQKDSASVLIQRDAEIGVDRDTGVGAAGDAGQDLRGCLLQKISE